MDSATNRTTKVGNVNTAHDAAGNMTNDTFRSYAYDAENRAKTVNGTQATYSYDPAGLRVKTVVGATTTVYIFSGAKVVAEYVNGALAREYLYSGSQLLATIEGSTTTYHHFDHLSQRVATNAAGAQAATFAHYAFGEYWEGGTTKWQFTSYEREAGDTGVDYAIFRNYSNRLGRFMMPDPIAGDITNPQSLGRYSYVLNNPINAIDPLGLEGEDLVAGLELPYWKCSLDGFEITCWTAFRLAYSDAVVNVNYEYNSRIKFGADGYVWTWTPGEHYIYKIWFDGTLIDNGSKTVREGYWVRGGVYSSSLVNLSRFVDITALPWKKVPWTAGGVLPIRYGVGIAFGFTHIPENNTWCYGLGLGATTPQKEVSASPLLFGPLDNAQDIVGGFGVTANLQPSPTVGGVFVFSPSGVLGGPSAATGSGVSLGIIFGGPFSGCHSFAK